jgi:hypothetical protein
VNEQYRIPPDLPRLFSRPDRLDHQLYVVTVVVNPVRFRNRWKLFEDFELMVHHAGAILYTVEVAFGDRAFAVTTPDNPRNIQLRTFHELWLKENAINIGVSRLPADWRKVAWLDSDMIFTRPDWANETLHALEHWPLVQMWSEMYDINPEYELIGPAAAFVDLWRKDAAKGCSMMIDKSCERRRYGGRGSPGLAWAARREAWDAIGGLIDVSITGAGDWYLAHALTDQLELGLTFTPPGLANAVRSWEKTARTGQWQERPIIGNIGVVPGTALHHWHGSRLYRRYNEREAILRRHQFDPMTDLKKDWQGLWQLAGNKPQLRRELQHYFHQRREDG